MLDAPGFVLALALIGLLYVFARWAGSRRAPAAIVAAPIEQPPNAIDPAFETPLVAALEGKARAKRVRSKKGR